MSKLAPNFFLLNLVIVLAGCNENRDDNMALPSQQTSFKGLVLGANAIQGAIVCLDTNDNLLCEAQEPQAKTNQLGVYQFDANALMAKQSSIVAYIPQGAMDVVTKEIIDKPYTLTTPIGKHAVISPLTSFVMETMRLHQGMDIDTASQIVSYQLKITNVDLFKDYRNYSGSQGELIKEIAKNRFAFDSVTDFASTYSSAVRFVLKQTSTAIFFKENDPLNWSKYITYIHQFDIKNEIGFNTKKVKDIPPSSLLNDSQLYSFNCVSYSKCDISTNTVLRYSKINFIKSAEDIFAADSIYEYDPIAKTTNNVSENTLYYKLIKDDWVEQSNIASLSTKSSEYSVLLYKISLSNFSIQLMLDKYIRDSINYSNYFFDSRTQTILDTTKKFPINSYMYKMIRISSKDLYTMKNLKERDNIFLDNNTLKSISDIKKYAITEKSNIIGSMFELRGVGTGLFSYYFKASLASNNTVNLVVTKTDSNHNFLEETIEPNRGIWEEINTPNNKLLKITIDSYRHSTPYKTNPFFVEYQNKLIGSKWIAAGYVEENYMFNETAMNAIKEAILVKP